MPPIKGTAMLAPPQGGGISSMMRPTGPPPGITPFNPLGPMRRPVRRPLRPLGSRMVPLSGMRFLQQ